MTPAPGLSRPFVAVVLGAVLAAGVVRAARPAAPAAPAWRCGGVLLDGELRELERQLDALPAVPPPAPVLLAQ